MLMLLGKHFNEICRIYCGCCIDDTSFRQAVLLYVTSICTHQDSYEQLCYVVLFNRVPTWVLFYLLFNCRVFSLQSICPVGTVNFSMSIQRWKFSIDFSMLLWHFFQCPIKLMKFWRCKSGIDILNSMLTFSYEFQCFFVRSTHWVCCNFTLE